MPEKKPYKAAMAATDPKDLAAMRQRQSIPVMKVQGMMTLKGPIRSATRLGRTRPKVLAALMMARR